MTYLTALLPVAQGVAVLAALTREADSRRAAGDARSRGQVMADTLVQRVTGQASAPDVPLTVNVVISDQALLGDAGTAHLPGFGPVPADLVRQSVSETTTIALRRLYACPATGRLVAMESRARTFPDALARFIEFRDQACATPWCDAPIRHTDHVVPHEDGGPTAVTNGQGVCVACNHAKQAAGWASATRAVTTPTGHHYRSHAPPAPPPQAWPSRAEVAFGSLVLAS
jgi:hypothetical protein